MTHEVLLFYKYVTIADPKAVMDSLRALALSWELTGRVLVAEEGINATLEGLPAATSAFLEEFLLDPRFADSSVKRSGSAGNSFPKLSVKVRSEIVGTQFPRELADPERSTAPRVTPETLRSWYENQEDFVVVDMRNDYEYASGHFKDSIHPGIQSSRELPGALSKLESLKHKKVVTVCTGGVRCEKMSAYLESNGFEDVYQLEDGIHGYMEKYPGKDFLGALYTFDQRVTMDFGGEREIIGICRLCESKTEHYVNCANEFCHLHFLACSDCVDESGRAHCTPGCSVDRRALPSPVA